MQSSPGNPQSIFRARLSAEALHAMGPESPVMETLVSEVRNVEAKVSGYARDAERSAARRGHHLPAAAGRLAAAERRLKRISAVTQVIAQIALDAKTLSAAMAEHEANATEQSLRHREECLDALMLSLRPLIPQVVIEPDRLPGVVGSVTCQSGQRDANRLAPIVRAAADLAADNEECLQKRATELERLTTELMYFQVCVDRGEQKQVARVQEVQQDIAEVHAHVQRMRDRVELLRNDPVAAFLPIGSIVRVRAPVPAADAAAGRTAAAKAGLPIGGAVGVVSGLRHEGQYPISVSFLDDLALCDGTVLAGDDDRPITFGMDASDLEVVGYSKLPDGSPYTGYGFLATHQARRNHAKHRDSTDEMVLEGLGRFLRFHDFGGKQSIELLHARRSLADYSWIEGPSEAFAPAACG